jgi:Cft2 family RNA processing exonuclease
MRLTFLGGADEVGASSTLIDIAGKRILVDAGIRISAKTRRAIEDDQLPDLRLISEAGGIDYLLVTHAHTDHTGALPLIVEQYPDVPVLATAPSLALIRVLQADAQKIMKSKHEEEGELPLFDSIAVDRLMSALQIVEPRQAIRLGDDLQVTYHTSGHIIGAASLVLESAEGTLVMSGDLSLTPQRAVTKAAPPNVKADALVLESTYGGKLHANRAAEEKRLIETLKRVTAAGGKVLIPAFALGRAQEVLQIILAYRDQLDVPVYADGMVRAVCRAYAQYADWLPEATTRAAGDDPLFFRANVKAVDTALERDSIIHAATPAVIVASSGMLTGGASAYYAQRIAGDTRNAILLTGYQDEESPGRALQKAIAERANKPEVTIRIAGKPVNVRCELGTYSLSAHADEAELVSLAESFGAGDVLLVHGDPTARESLARAIRARSKGVQLPQSGSSIELTYKRKVWAIGRTKATHAAHAGSAPSDQIDPAALWAAVKGSAGGFFTARELALVWTGDANDAETIAAILRVEGVHFGAAGSRWQARTPAQIASIQRRRAILAAFPTLHGMIAYLREDGKPRIGVIINVDADNIEAIMSTGTKKTFAADLLIYPIAPYTGERKAIPAALRHMTGVARQYADTLLTPAVRAALAADEQPIDPRTLIPPAALQPPLTQNVSASDMALLAIIMRMAADGAHLQPDGRLQPGAALAPQRMEQNAARDAALNAFPAGAYLRKVGMDVSGFRLILTFDFPDVAVDHYREILDSLGESTGWEIVVQPITTQQALQNALIGLLPPSATLKAISHYPDKRALNAEIGGTFDKISLARDFAALTGHTLNINPKQAPPEKAPDSAFAFQKGRDQPATTDTDAMQPSPSAAPMEINAAYGVVRAALEPYGLQRAGLKEGRIVLTFISPQVGARCTDAIAVVSAQIGYPMSIHPHPDQTAITARVMSIIRHAGWTPRKNPSLRTDRGEVMIALAQAASEAEIAEVAEDIERETGYRLIMA